METDEIRTLGRGATVTFAGGFVGAGLTYVTGVLVARLVGPELLGVYFLSLIWVNLGSTVGRVGFSDALLRFVPPARLKGDRGEALRLIKTTVLIGLAVGFLVAATLYVSLVVLRLIPIEPLLASYLSWFVWAVPLHVVFVLMLVVVQAHQKMGRLTAVRDLLQPALLIGLTIALVLALGAKAGLIGGFLASLLISLPVAWWMVRGLAPGLFSESGWMSLRPLLAFSLPVMLSDASHYLYRWLDTLVVERFLSLRDVGLYNAASRTAMLISLVLLGANAIYASVASGFFSTAQPRKLEKALEYSIRWCLIVSLPVVVIFALAGDWILLLWGTEFAEAAGVLTILALAHLIGIPAGLFAYTLLMSNRQVMEMVDTIVVLGALFALTLILVPRYGMAGAAVGLLGANLLAFGVRWIQVKMVVGVRALAVSLWKPMAAAAGAFLTGLVLRGPIQGLLAGDVPSPDPVVLLLQLMALGLVVVVSFLGPYLIIDREGWNLVRLSMPEFPGGPVT